VSKRASARKLRAAIVGSNQTVQRGLEQLVATTGANEVIVVTDTYDPEARLDSYRRVAQIAQRIETKADAVA